MVGKYKAYPEYKDSGVEWLGYIPEHWQIWKLAHAFEIIGSGTTPPSDTNDWYGDDINWVTTGELREDIILSTSKKIKKKTLQYFSTLKIYPKGTILIAMYGATIGRLGILGESATTNQACCALSKSNYLSNMYLFYWLISFRQEIIQLSSGGGQPNINQEKVASLKISTPTLKEQKKIINFLTYETSKIDTLIEKQQQLIKLLEEKRQAVISHAVTKGLNPNFPMKESEIDWVKNIPYHWGKTPMRWSTKIFSGGTPSKNKEEYWENGTIPWLNSGSVNQKKITTPSAYITKKGYLYSSAKWIPRNSLVIALAGQGKTKGMVAIVDIDTTCNQSMGAIIPNKNKFITTYLYYWLLINYQNIRNLSGGDLRDGLNLELIADIECPMPPLEEQEKICSFIEKEIFIINQLNDKTNQVIDLLKEHRTALISAAVTGKIDVRNWQAPTVTD